MIYTFKVHYDDGESLESVEAESRLRALAKLRRRHEYVNPGAVDFRAIEGTRASF
jgi:hypothetical protein